ncbi:MAG: hypothetical protein R3F30_15385 [Planctomycetota bacterium]
MTSIWWWLAGLGLGYFLASKLQRLADLPAEVDGGSGVFTLRHPAMTKAFVLMFMALGLAMVGLGLAEPVAKEKGAYLLFGAILAVGMLLSFRESCAVVRFDERGISKSIWWRKDRRIEWEDVREIRGTWWLTSVVFKAPGATIPVGMFVRGMLELMDFVRDRFPEDMWSQAWRRWLKTRIDPHPWE